MWSYVNRYSATRAVFIALFCTCFDAFNIPVFWPILVMYFFVLFFMTMKRQIKVLKQKNTFRLTSSNQRCMLLHVVWRGICVAAYDSLPVLAIQLWQSDISRQGGYWQVHTLLASLSSTSLSLIYILL